MNVGDRVRLLPDGAWKTVTSASAAFVTLDGHVVSRRLLEQYLASGRVVTDDGMTE